MLTVTTKKILEDCVAAGYRVVEILNAEHPTEILMQPVTANASPALITYFGLDDYILIGGQHAVHSDDLNDGKARRFSVEFVVVPGDCPLTEDDFWSAKMQERREIKRRAAAKVHQNRRDQKVDKPY